MIEKLIKNNDGIINGEVLAQWCGHFNLSSREAAKVLSANTRTFEAWRSNRHKTPKYLIFAIKNAEAKLLKKKELKNT